MSATSVKNFFTLTFLLPISCFLCSCEHQKDQKEQKAAQVRYMVLESQDIDMTWELPGRISAFTVSDVRPQVSGIIQKRFFTEGADVKAGDVLYQIDPKIYQAAYNNAKANLAKAEANATSAKLLFQRYAKLVKTNAVSRQEHDDAEAAFKHATADVAAAHEALETAKINLGYTKVTAPISGRIGRSFVTSGALVTQNQPEPLATIQQTNQVYVDVTYPTADLLKMRRSLARGHVKADNENTLKVKLKLEDNSPYVRLGTEHKEGEPAWIEGNLMFSDITVDQSTGVVNIRAKFKNPDNVLLPGMYVRAVLNGGIKQGTIVIPQKTVQRDFRGNPIVYVLSKEKPTETHEQIAALNDNEYYVHRRSVTIEGDYKDNTWQISSGLKAGDFILVDGLQKIAVGQIVNGINLNTETFLAMQSEAQTAKR